MNSEFTKKVDKEINEYKNALIYDAKVCDWKTFEGKAGMLFGKG